MIKEFRKFVNIKSIHGGLFDFYSIWDLWQCYADDTHNKDYTIYYLSEIKFFCNKGIAIFWHLNVQWLSQYLYMICSISFIWDIRTTQKDFREDLIRQKKDPSKPFNSDLFIIFIGMSSFTKRRISLLSVWKARSVTDFAIAIDLLLRAKNTW